MAPNQSLAVIFALSLELPKSPLHLLLGVSEPGLLVSYTILCKSRDGSWDK